jgi:hypothetical protein
LRRAGESEITARKETEPLSKEMKEIGNVATYEGLWGPHWLALLTINLPN